MYLSEHPPSGCWNSYHEHKAITPLATSSTSITIDSLAKKLHIWLPGAANPTKTHMPSEMPSN